VDIGQVGSVDGATVFERSDLHQKLSLGESGLDQDQHLIGAQNYPLSTSVLTPFKQTDEFDETKKRFNKRLSETRVVIEKAFALLKGRFRKLRYVSMRRLDLISMVVSTCCILHNVCIFNDDWEWVDIEGPDDIGGIDQDAVNQLSNADDLQKSMGEAKRAEIAQRC